MLLASDRAGPAEDADPDAAPTGPGIFTNSTLNVAGLASAGLFGALSGLIVARTLGPAGVGILAVIAGLIEFGRTFSNFTHSPSIIAFHREGADPDAVFGTSFTIKFVGAMLFTGAAALLAPVVAPIFHVPPWAIVLMSATLILGVPFEIGTARLEAENRMLKRNLILVLGPLSGLVAVLVLVALGRVNVYTIIATSLLGTTIMSLAFATRAYNPFRLRYDSRIGRYLATYGMRLLAISFLTQMLVWTDTLMLSGLRGNVEAGVYNVAYQLTFVMVTASGAVGTALMPALSELAGRGKDTSEGYARGTLITLVMSVALALGYVLLGPFVLQIYGAGFAGAYAPLLVLMAFGAATAMAIPAASLLTVHGHAGTLTWVSVGQVALNVPLNYVLITAHGVVGAAVATTTTAVLGLGTLWFLAWRTTGATPLRRSVIAEAARAPREFLARRRE